jgi:hypothetical protein
MADERITEAEKAVSDAKEGLGKAHRDAAEAYENDSDSGGGFFG